MRVKLIKYLFAIWFSMLLLIGNTPMDFIHLFADHKDTTHNIAHDNGPAIENSHHHCAYLSLTLASFVNDHSKPFVVFEEPATYLTLQAAISVHYIQRSIVAVSLRGPPFA